jgi:FdhD protein
MTMRPVQSLGGLSLRQGTAHDASRALPEEWAVAFVYNGSTRAVMMATPADLTDFAIGFSLTEGIATPEQIAEVEVVEHDLGSEVQMWVGADRAEALAARARASIGPVGCGLCGIDSLEQALRPLPTLPESPLRLTQADIDAAVNGLRAGQPMHDQTRAMHAAGFYVPGKGLTHVREDVGRHNALDKLIGALARDGVDRSTGAMVITSRVSVDMVQKTVMAGCPALIAVSAPTAHAVRLARDAGLTLIALARGDGADVFSGSHRITYPPQGNGGPHVIAR